jgi:hypothetical protein
MEMRATFAVRVSLTLFPSICSNITDSTLKELFLDGPDDPLLIKYRLDPSGYHQFPYAQLYALYWGKIDQELIPDTFVQLPTKVLSNDELYIFSQYSYMEQRVDSFREVCREKRDKAYAPPGLALIGTPGVGELVPIHLCI